MGLNYIGSKYSILNFIDESIQAVIGNNRQKTFCDLFAGSGAVGNYFKNKGYSVIANDLQYYSYVINKNKIGNHKTLLFRKLTPEIRELKNSRPVDRQQIVCDYLNALKGIKGFIYQNYSPTGSHDQRKYFSDENSKKCDAIRQQIEKWYEQAQINDNEYFFLVSSLLESIDQYANTACIYGAFLKEFKKTAKSSLILQPAKFTHHDAEHQIYNEDANTLVKEKKIKADICYLDPPYNHRQYSTNYHMLETIALYDNPTIRGVTGLRNQEKKSDYCSRIAVLTTFEDLIDNIDANYIFLSYNNEGLMNFDDIQDIMSKRGEYKVFRQKHRRYKADNGRFNKADATEEYLHAVVCT